MSVDKPFRRGHVFGKYKIIKLIGQGGFARVYSATDTIEGLPVALKLPHEQFVDKELLDQFRREIRITAKLQHENILSVKNAEMIDGHLVVVTKLGVETLDDRLQRRLATTKAFALAAQMLDAVAYAHEQGVIHCDIKPENFILFDDDVIRLADFGIAKVSRMTVAGSGTGTIGHMAPEQAMGKPSMRSDVFSLGLVFYRMFSGAWPEYPFQWPPPNAMRLRSKHIHPDFIALIKKAIEPQPNKRFADALRMQSEFETVLPKALRNLSRSRK
jgi:serine/threonine-protein kinase